jgi:Immunity protein Imm1
MELGMNNAIMKKETYFASRDRKGWPDPKELEPYFLAPPGKRWFFETSNDEASLSLKNPDNTQADTSLDMTGHPEHGVFLEYKKWGGGYRDTYYSNGDLTRLAEHVRTLHDCLLPIGLFIPFEEAWKAVKEFMETEGMLPRSIDWIASHELPPDTFPPP